MSASRDLDRAIQDYFEAGPTQVTERSYDEVRSQIERIPQRIAIGPWRMPDMSSYKRYAIAGAVVLALALVGVNLLPRQQPSVGTPSSSPASTPAASQERLSTNEHPLAAGTYTAGQPFVVPLTFTVPDGWTGKIDGPYALFLRRGDTEISFASNAAFYQNPCQSERGLLDADSGAAWMVLTRTISAAPGFELSARNGTGVDLGRQSAWAEMTITAPISAAGCPMPAHGFPIWQVQPYGYPVGYISNESYTFDPGVTPALPMGATKALRAGQTDHVSIFQVDGEHFLIDYTLADESDLAQQAEVKAILDSVQINAVP